MMTPIEERISKNNYTIEIFEKLDGYISKLNNLAVEIYHPDSISINSRLLSLAQAIVSIAVVCLAPLELLIWPIMATCMHSFEQGKLGIAEVAKILGKHLFQIPESLIGVIFPSILTQPIPRAQLNQAPQQLGNNERALYQEAIANYQQAVALARGALDNAARALNNPMGNEERVLYQQAIADYQAALALAPRGLINANIVFNAN